MQKRHRQMLECFGLMRTSSDFTYAGNFGGLAYPCCCQQFSNFPGKNRRIFPFALDDCRDDPRSEKPRSAPPDGLWLQESCAAVAAQDLTDAPVGHLKCAVFHFLNFRAYLVTLLSTKGWPERQDGNTARCLSQLFSPKSEPLVLKPKCGFLVQLCERRGGVCVLEVSWRSGLDGLPPRPTRSSSSAWIPGEVCR